MDESSFLGLPEFVWWALLLVFGNIFATFFVRKTCEGVWPGLQTRPFWRDRFLPLFPLVLGAFFALADKNYNYPAGVGDHRITRALYGFVIGGASGWIFKIVKSRVKSTWGVEIGFSDSPPPGGMEVKVNLPPQSPAPKIESPKDAP